MFNLVPFEVLTAQFAEFHILAYQWLVFGNHNIVILMKIPIGCFEGCLTGYNQWQKLTHGNYLHTGVLLGGVS